MGTFTSNDAPLGQIIQKMLNLIGLNVLWFLCSLPVFTLGAATTALHFALGHRESDTDESVYRRFFRAFRREFKSATLLWMFLLVLGLLLCLCLRIVSFWPGPFRTAGIVFFCLPGLLLLIIAGYGFPLLSQFEIPAKKLLGDALLLGLAYFPRTLLIIGLNLLPLLLWYVLPSLLLSLLFLWLPMGFSLTALLIEICLEPVFAPLREQKQP